MNDPELLWRILEVAGAVIVGLLSLLWWFLRRDRATVYHTLGAHGVRIDELKTDVDRVKETVYGTLGNGGVDQRFRGVEQMLKSELGLLGDRIEKLTIAIARANPTMRLDDIR